MEHVWHEATASSATACANSDVAAGGPLRVNRARGRSFEF